VCTKKFSETIQTDCKIGVHNVQKTAGQEWNYYVEQLTHAYENKGGHLYQFKVQKSIFVLRNSYAVLNVSGSDARCRQAP